MSPVPALPETDLTNPEHFAEGFPHAFFARLRREAPVFRHPEPPAEGPGFWVISKYDDVKHVSRRPHVFCSGEGTTRPDIDPQRKAMMQLIMLNMDPPKHVKYRRIVQRGFTPRMVSQMEQPIRAQARRIVDAIAEKGTCEFVKEVAAELPLQVLADLLGVPQEERFRIFDLSNRLIGFEDPEFQTSPEDAQRASAEMWAYANELAERKRKVPGDDLTTVLMTGEVDGERLTEPEFDSFFLLMAVAGNETTRNLISHGMLNLMQHPDQRQRLIDDPSLLATAVEEMLRYSPPVMYFRRTATEDTEIRGVPIAAGDKVCMYYPSVNRDEEVFPDPDVFDVGRTPNEHLAFGIGEHFCLGANLARLEITIVFEELIRRLPDMEIAGPVRRLRSTFIDGIKEIPVRYTPQRGRATRAA
ncbi:MAG TPA: cytochrome P450 [Longimicrobiales bacterium]|nr:cytochrome P450 [Longimicrobiales bacterium]